MNMGGGASGSSSPIARAAGAASIHCDPARPQIGRSGSMGASASDPRVRAMSGGDMEVAALFGKMFATLRRWLEVFAEMLPNILVAALVLIVFGYGSRWVGRLVRKVLDQVTAHHALSDLLGTIARVLTVITGLIIALGLLQLDKTVTSLLAGVGVIGLALGFAFQDIAANFMSGFIMAIKRPFEVGDLVEVGGQSGIVQRLELRATLLTTLQGLSVIIPNKDIFQHPIINYTRTGDRRLDLTVGVAYHTSLAQAREVAIQAVRDVPGRNPEREPEAFFTDFGDMAIRLTVHLWLTEADDISYLTARSRAIEAIKAAFDVHAIAMPFTLPTLDVGASARPLAPAAAKLR